jgi:uncharacterized protein (TIGR00730 family)
MSLEDARDALLAAVLAERPQSRQRRELLRSLIEKVVYLAETDTDTLDLKIAEAAVSELVEAFEVFSPYRDVRKVTLFGSARTSPASPLYKMAHDFAESIAEQGWMVVTGAGPGIMAAGIQGAGRLRSFGVNILLPFEQGANEFIVDDDKLIEMRYFFTRKVMLTKESSAFAMFPGGFGTLDECFELLTLLQTGKAMPAPVILVDEPEGKYWREWLRFIEDRVAAEGYVSRGDERFFTIVDSVEQAVSVACGFYANYRSFRMVREKAVMRLAKSPSDEQLAQLNERYRDMVLTGEIERSAPLAVEVASNDELDAERLVWNFNRRDYGLLRQMIDDVNGFVRAPG